MKPLKCPKHESRNARRVILPVSESEKSLMISIRKMTPQVDQHSAVWSAASQGSFFHFSIAAAFILIQWSYLLPPCPTIPSQMLFPNLVVSCVGSPPLEGVATPRHFSLKGWRTKNGLLPSETLSQFNSQNKIKDYKAHGSKRFKLSCFEKSYFV